MCVHVYFCLCMRSLRLSKVHTIRLADKFTELGFLLFNLLVRSYFSYFKFIFFVQSQQSLCSNINIYCCVSHNMSWQESILICGSMLETIPANNLLVLSESKSPLCFFEGGEKQTLRASCSPCVLGCSSLSLQSSVTGLLFWSRFQVFCCLLLTLWWRN